MPATSANSSTLAKDPFTCRNSTMRCARISPTPGSDSSARASAVFKSSCATGVPRRRRVRVRRLPVFRVRLPAGADSPARNTSISSPSLMRSAKFTAAGSAAGVIPPARRTASSAREPSASRYRPGRKTAPTTYTTTWFSGAVCGRREWDARTGGAAMDAGSAGGGAGRRNARKARTARAAATASTRFTRAFHTQNLPAKGLRQDVTL